MNKYSGPLNMAKMNVIQKRAYKAWKDQRQRCYNSKDPRFYAYGAKGITHRLDPREFISWYEKKWEQLTEKQKISRVHCGRIDHAKDYTIDNIKLESIFESVSERNSRLGNPSDSKPVIFENINTGEIKTFSSKKEAVRELGISRRLIRHQLSGKMRRAPRSGWIVRENTP